MLNHRLLHDIAWATTTSLFETLGLEPTERATKKLFQEFYLTVKAAIEAYEEQLKKEQHRLKPI
jgi:hypothetical protein